MSRIELTKKQRIKAHEFHDGDPDDFDIWMLNYVQDISDTTEMKYNDFIYVYYLEKARIKKINSILDGD